jgi:bacterial/archaeal transporter family protein
VASAPAFVWLAPTLGALVAWGVAQGLVKKYIAEVPPARFCLYYAAANGLVNTLFWWLSDGKPPVLALEHREFLTYGLLAYLLDGVAWIFYYQSIVYGPVSIVGTLSAAYPALTVLFARAFLSEVLAPSQYVGVVAIILGCLALAYEPATQRTPTRTRWVPLAGTALVIWGANGTLIRYAYRFPGAHEANMALCVAVGGLATLGVYGLLFGRRGATSGGEWRRSFLPMGTMAVGSLLAAIAYKEGPASIVTPLSGAYPTVTLVFAWLVLKERPTALQWGAIASILVGMVLTTMVAA